MFESIISWLREVWNHFKPILFLYNYEAGVVFRAGKFIKELKPGSWYFRIPFIDDIFVENIATGNFTFVAVKDKKSADHGVSFNDEILTD